MEPHAAVGLQNLSTQAASTLPARTGRDALRVLWRLAFSDDSLLAPVGRLEALPRRVGTSSLQGEPWRTWGLFWAAFRPIPQEGPIARLLLKMFDADRARDIRRLCPPARTDVGRIRCGVSAACARPSCSARCTRLLCAAGWTAVELFEEFMAASVKKLCLIARRKASNVGFSNRLRYLRPSRRGSSRAADQESVAFDFLWRRHVGSPPRVGSPRAISPRACSRSFIQLGNHGHDSVRVLGRSSHPSSLWRGARHDSIVSREKSRGSS